MNRLIPILFFMSVLFLGVSAGYSQDGGDGDFGGLNPVDGGGVDNGGVDGNVGNNQGGGGGGNAPLQPGELPTEVGEMIADDRSQGFPGPTAEAIEAGDAEFPGGSPGFVGATAEAIEANSGAPDVQRDGGSAGQGSALGQMNGFTVSRSAVRARVVPNFSYNPVPNEVVARGFEQRMFRLPVVRDATAMGVRVQIEGTTALLSGMAANEQAVDDLMGQLRMEPGVYRIINDVRIATTGDQNGGLSGLSSSSN